MFQDGLAECEAAAIRVELGVLVELAWETRKTILKDGRGAKRSDTSRVPFLAGHKKGQTASRFGKGTL